MKRSERLLQEKRRRFLAKNALRLANVRKEQSNFPNYYK
jgi:hypothetical protein